jgi:hypothetical protein
VDKNGLLLQEINRRKAYNKMDKDREVTLKEKKRELRDKSTDSYFARITFPKKSTAGSQWFEAREDMERTND